MATKRTVPGLKYLAGWRGISGSDKRALDPLEEVHSCFASVESLTELGFIVSINGTVGNYYVRCLPLRVSPYRVAPGVSMVYTGEDLEYVLACAAYEADLLFCDEGGAILQEQECTRWAHV